MYSYGIGGDYWRTEALITARKRSLRRLCFHRCLSLHRVSVSVQEGLCSEGVSVRGSLSSRGLCVGGSLSWRPPLTVTSGTHPTGMHSCFDNEIS